MRNKRLRFREVGFHLEIRPYLIVWEKPQNNSEKEVSQ
jgi:hypothetical protein